MKFLICSILLFSSTSFATVEGRWAGDFHVHVTSEAGVNKHELKSGYVNIIFPHKIPNLLFINQSFHYGYYILGLVGPAFEVTNSDISYHGKQVGSFSKERIDFSIATDNCTQTLHVIAAEDADGANNNRNALVYNFRAACTNNVIIEINAHLRLDPIH